MCDDDLPSAPSYVTVLHHRRSRGLIQKLRALHRPTVALPIGSYTSEFVHPLGATQQNVRGSFVLFDCVSFVVSLFLL